MISQIQIRHKLNSLIGFNLAAITAAFMLASCSGQGDDVIDPDANERNETALIVVNDDSGGELAQYYEVSGLVNQTEYESVNGEQLGKDVDAIYEAYENVFLHSNATGEITVLDLSNRRKLATISGFPTGDAGQLSGMAFSNLSQGWVIAYGSDTLYHIDVRNHVLVRRIPLPGNPTAITTLDNRVMVCLQDSNGTGLIGEIASNDPDFTFNVKLELPRPAFFAGIDTDADFLILLFPGALVDDPNTREIDTDPLLYAVDLLDYSIAFDIPFFAPSMNEYVGRHPNFATLTRDSYLYLATSDGLKRIDTKSFGVISDFFPGKAYSVVAADYWTDLVYAVPTNAPTTVERKTKRDQTLPSFSVDHPIRSMSFVSTSKVQLP